MYVTLQLAASHLEMATLLVFVELNRGSFTKKNPKSDLGSKLGFGVLGATLGTVHEINLGERIKNS